MPALSLSARKSLRIVTLVLFTLQVTLLTLLIQNANAAECCFSNVPDEIEVTRGDELDIFIKVSCDPDEVTVTGELEGLGIKANLEFSKWNETYTGGWFYAKIYPFYKAGEGLIPAGKPDELLLPGTYTLTLQLQKAGRTVDEVEIPLVISPLELNVKVPSEVLQGDELVVEIYTNRKESEYNFVYAILDLKVRVYKYSVSLENGFAELRIPTASIMPGSYRIYIRDAMKTLDPKGRDVEEWYDIPPSDAYAREFYAQDDVLVVKEVRVLSLLPTPTPTPSLASTVPSPIPTVDPNKEAARNAIENAEKVINQIKLEGVVVKEAEDLLSNSKLSFKSNDYKRARSLAEKAKSKAEELKSEYLSALEVIGIAEEKLNLLKSEGIDAMGGRKVTFG